MTNLGWAWATNMGTAVLLGFLDHWNDFFQGCYDAFQVTTLGFIGFVNMFGHYTGYVVGFLVPPMISTFIIDQRKAYCGKSVVLKKQMTLVGSTIHK